MKLHLRHTENGPHLEVSTWRGTASTDLSAEAADTLADGLQQVADPDAGRDRVVLDTDSVWARREDGLVRISVDSATCPVSPDTARKVAANLVDPDPTPEPEEIA